mmetsp:Transcript_54479/g.165561  ORF Transcript_54479/g.165561 Transcript_54479/m.165561 type:complete len:353 (+) Transcript_54479:118-1176(+)
MAAARGGRGQCEPVLHPSNRGEVVPFPVELLKPAEVVVVGGEVRPFAPDALAVVALHLLRRHLPGRNARVPPLLGEGALALATHPARHLFVLAEVHQRGKIMRLATLDSQRVVALHVPWWDRLWRDASITVALAHKDFVSPVEGALVLAQIHICAAIMGLRSADAARVIPLHFLQHRLRGAPGHPRAPQLVGQRQDVPGPAPLRVLAMHVVCGPPKRRTITSGRQARTRATPASCGCRSWRCRLLGEARLLRAERARRVGHGLPPPVMQALLGPAARILVRDLLGRALLLTRRLLGPRPCRVRLRRSPALLVLEVAEEEPIAASAVRVVAFVGDRPQAICHRRRDTARQIPT